MAQGSKMANKKTAKTQYFRIESDGSERLLVEMIERFSVKRAVDWLRVKFSSFDTSNAQELPADATKNERDYFSEARLLGYVANFPAGKSNDENKPVLVAVIKMRKDLTERTSRLVQFNYAKKVLQNAVSKGAQGVSGLPSQGLFFFYDQDGYFRLSLVTGDVEKRRFKFNEAKRQSFYIEPDAANNIVKRRLTPPIRNFATLKEVFSVEQLTKEFYTKLFDWYTWAMSPAVGVSFPNDLDNDKDDRKYNNEAIIRMITRLMFTWFIRQRNLVPSVLFDRDALQEVLKKFDPDSMEEGNYYRAILQNLFFATFNCPQAGKGRLTRRWINADVNASGNGSGLSNDYRITTVYRYKNEFKKPDEFLELMRKVPFLNCALFDCLDKVEREVDGGRKLYFDGFSTKKKRQAYVPNGLFFDKERGIINLFNLFEFTVNENNADDSDVALDPELLGKVFENLLGAFNPETQETARKATGSFYTPREIVDYMVEESIKNYLKTKVPSADDSRLNDLFDKSKAAEGAETLFSANERRDILNALYNCKILDPACGSGAFPMGVLHCMVRLLTRLDPQCLSIREHLLSRYKTDKAIVDPAETAEERKERLAELESRLKEGQHYPDYERKLYLIENCIYGVDIQPIATQISKLRFFISLLCDQLRSSYDPDAANFGLLSLPNLEAKFVCANTLISLPEQENEFEFNQKISDLRMSLQENRHKIFRARSTKTKDKYKERDLEIRDAIRESVRDSLSKPDEQLIAKFEEEIKDAKERRKKVAEPDWYEENVQVQDDFFSEFQSKRVRKDRNEAERSKIDSEIAWAEKKIKEERAKGDMANISAAARYADMVAGWDPYDQNASSEFFDPEWMFNIKDGFDVVIGNPPYGAKVTPKEAKYFQKVYIVSQTIPGKQKGSTDTFAVFINAGFNALATQGVLAYIIPMSITSSDAMIGVHNLLFANCKEIFVSSFSNRPKQIFESAGLRTSILRLTKTDSAIEHLYTTRMMRRKNSDEISEIINSLHFVDSLDIRLEGRLPKVGYDIERVVLTKMFANSKVQLFIDKRNGLPLYYRSAGGRYWNVVTNYSTHTSAEKSIPVKHVKQLCACLSSSCFWFYQQVYTDGMNLKLFEVENFPVPDFDNVSEVILRQLAVLYDKYVDDIEKYARSHETSEASSYNIDNFKEYKIGYSKRIIDEIDDFIGPLYGLTREEIEFIKNYEIEFRMADYWTSEQMEEFISKRVDFIAGIGAEAAPGGTGDASERNKVAPGKPRRRPTVEAVNEDDEELE